MRRFLLSLLATLALPAAVNAESMKDQYKKSYGSSTNYSRRERLAKSCTIQKANFVNGNEHFCVFRDGTVGLTWSGPSSTGKPWGTLFKGIIDKPIRHNNHSQVEYSIEGGNLVRYSCYQISYLYDPNGKCETGNIRRKVVARSKY